MTHLVLFILAFSVLVWVGGHLWRQRTRSCAAAILRLVRVASKIVGDRDADVQIHVELHSRDYVELERLGVCESWTSDVASALTFRIGSVELTAAEVLEPGSPADVASQRAYAAMEEARARRHGPTGRSEGTVALMISAQETWRECRREVTVERATGVRSDAFERAAETTDLREEGGNAE